MASICCSPPESVPARCAGAPRESGKELVHALQVLLEVADRPVIAPICRFSSTVMRGKMRRPSGDQRDAACAISKVGSAGDLLALQQDAARPGGAAAADRHQQGRLAGAVGADQRDDLALGDLQARRPSGPRCGRRRCMHAFDGCSMAMAQTFTPDLVCGLVVLAQVGLDDRSDRCWTSAGVPSLIFWP
jgi:hypothetical protein